MPPYRASKWDVALSATKFDKRSNPAINWGMLSLEIDPRTYPSQGRCIFCLAPYPLTPPNTSTEEHVIPRALCCVGEIKIEDGSCTVCNAYANKRYEAKALATDFNVARILLDMKRRNRGKNKKPLVLPTVAVGDHMRNGDEAAFNLELTKEQYPNLFNLVMFEPAGKQLGVEKGSGFSRLRMVAVIMPRKKGEVRDVTIPQTHNHTTFCLTIAKIAYCYAAAELKLDGFNGDEMRSLLKGERDDVFNFVGGPLIEQRYEETKRLHTLKLIWRGDLLVVAVRLFAFSGMMPYEVVVGRKLAANN